MTRVAIMQPTYLPWSGYFGLMQMVDVFVFLDSVQFAKRSWQQRNQIKTANGPIWLTVPAVTKGKREQLICEVEIDSTSGFAPIHRKSLETNYARAKFFKDLASGFFSKIENSNNRLVDLNINLIMHCRSLLGITTPVLRSSDLAACGAKADLLAAICREIGATEYVSVEGSKGYLDESEAFGEIGVPVRYFNYNHPQYTQLYGDFVPYMSVIDMLFNCGEQSAKLIRSAVEVKL